MWLMNPLLLLLLVPPTIICVVMKWRCADHISWREMAIQFIVPIILVIGVWQISRWGQMHDVEVLNGQVTGKEQNWVPCSHSYQCHCRTVTSGSGKNATTSTVCDTCYEHANDWDWDVYTTVGNFTVSRIDSQGAYEPPRWSQVANGQPVAMEHSYTNYVKAAPESLFNLSRLSKDYHGDMPDYPRAYDYQYLDHVIAMKGVPVPNLAQWNTAVADVLRPIGPAKQANLLIVFSKGTPAFADALKAHWLGGKKNDIIVVVGTDYPNVRWVRVFSWAKHDLINVMLRNDIVDSKTLDPQATVSLIAKDITQYYERRPMAEFAYLAQEAIPSTWVMILALILATGASIGLGIFFNNNVCFESSTSRRSYRY